MLVEDLFQLDRLYEGPLADRIKTATTAGMIGLGALGAGMLVRQSQPTQVQRPSIAAQQAAVDDGAATATPPGQRQLPPPPAVKPRAPGFAANFPAKLRDQRTRSPDERKATFMAVMMPIIKAENARIMAERRFILHVPPHPTGAAKARLDALMKSYGASSYHDLLERVDVIPPQLALAQSALESGWATSHFARERNAFFGQKAFGGSAGSNGVFARFPSPEASVRAYMHNLNTNRAYSRFRAERAWMRSAHIKLNPVDLAKMLVHYDETGRPYTKKVSNLIIADRD